MAEVVEAIEAHQRARASRSQERTKAAKAARPRWAWFTEKLEAVVQRMLGRRRRRRFHRSDHAGNDPTSAERPASGAATAAVAATASVVVRIALDDDEESPMSESSKSVRATVELTEFELKRFIRVAMSKRKADSGASWQELMSEGFLAYVTGPDANLEMIPNWRTMNFGYGPAQKMTMLHHAARLGFHETAMMLVKLGADVEAVDIWGETPIQRFGLTAGGLYEQAQLYTVAYKLLALCAIYHERCGASALSCARSCPSDILRIVWDMLRPTALS